MLYRSSENGCGCSASSCFPYRNNRSPACCPGCFSFSPGTSSPRMSLLNAAVNSSQTLAGGAALPFALNTVASGNEISHSPGTAVLSLNAPGNYVLYFHATVRAPAGTTATALLQAELQLNGSTVPGASASATLDNENDSVNLSFSTAFTVSTVPSTISIVFAEPGAVVTAASCTVLRCPAAPALPPLPCCSLM